MTIREGLLVGDDAVSQYDGDPMGGPSLPLTLTQSSQINAEFVYRGSTIAPSNRITLPASTNETQSADTVEICMNSMQSLNVRDAMDRARSLWTEMLDAKSYPNDEQIISLIASLQFPTIRDQLMADIPGIAEPMDRILLAQTDSKPHWSRVEWAEQLLLHAYTRSSNRHSAPILTAIAFIKLVGRQRQQGPPVPATRPRSRPRLLPGQAQRPNDQLRIHRHVMPFRPPSCMDRYLSENRYRPQHEPDRKNNQQVMLYAALATMNW